MNEKTTITLKDGSQIVLKYPEELQECDKSKEIALVFNNFQIYVGTFVELYEEDDETEIVLQKTNSMFSISLPFDRLIGWGYIEKKNSEKDENNTKV